MMTEYLSCVFSGIALCLQRQERKQEEAKLKETEGRSPSTGHPFSRIYVSSDMRLLSFSSRLRNSLSNMQGIHIAFAERLENQTPNTQLTTVEQEFDDI